jgi:predicted phosphodiesterase
MKLGLMSDIHGNATATRAVIDDARMVGVEQWWVLGDIVALGPNPVEVLEIIADLPHVECIAGNTERYVLSGDRPFPSFDDARADPHLIPRLVEVAASLAWTRGAVTQAGWYSWLDCLGSELRRTLPDGTRLLGVHASPRSDDGRGIDSRVSDDDLAELLHGCEADVVFGGHTHDLTDRIIGKTRAVNLGSVSNSTRDDRCATYAVVHIEPGEHRIEQRVVDYDHSTEVYAIDRVRHPAAGYLRRFHEPVNERSTL